MRKLMLVGRLDTVNAPAIDTEISKQLEGCDATAEVVLDCRNLEYISSTGLRVVLKYKKLYPNLRVENVSNDIYNIFEMTGFTRIIPVSKALRRIDLNACTRLAHGANGEVYKINDEEIVKLSLFANRENELVDEMNMAREAFVMGVPTMISFDMVEVSDGRRGIVLEALNSTTLADQLKAHPEQLDDYIEPYVNLFRQTNAIVAQPGQFRLAKQLLLDRLMAPTRFLDDERTAALKSLVEALPDAMNLIHGDGHPCNALLCGNDGSRNLMLIDMGDLAAGHPIFEIMGWAFLMNGTDYSHTPIVGPKATGLDYPFLQQIFRKMLSSYLGITDEATLEKAICAAGYVGLLRILCCDQVRNLPIEKQERCIRVLDETLARRQQVLDSIALLTELIK